MLLYIIHYFISLNNSFNIFASNSVIKILPRLRQKNATTLLLTSAPFKPHSKTLSIGSKQIFLNDMNGI